jgi:outer membrane receptor protein involved in Fe transport
MTQHSTAQHSTAQHSTAQHSTAQHSTDFHDMKIWCLGVAGVIFSASVWSETVAGLPTVTITGARGATLEPWVQSPSGVGEISVVTSKEIEAKPAAQIEDLLQSAGLAAASASSSFGLAPSLGIRGFSVNTQSGSPSLITSKILVNGHADIANGFNRDMSTVERI